MKKKNKFLAVLLTLAVLICMTGFTANAATKATSITFSKTTDATVRVGYAITRAAVTTPEGLAVTYTSSDTSIADVNENGRVVGKKPGNVVITASAGGLKGSYNVSVVADDVTVSTKVFEGYNVTVLDKTTPAVSARGRVNDRNVMCFISATDQEVGVISHSDYNAVIQKNQKVVNLPGGGTYGAPPVDGKSWEDWFADEFNKYRGLGTESREEAVATNRSEVMENYRQEVIRLTNIERENAGLDPLAVNEDAMAFAQIRAQEVVSNYSHTRPNGEPLRVNGDIVNENVGAKSTPETQVQSWMASEGHRGNILNPDAYAIGVGAYQTDSGAFYWIQIFMW